MNRHDVDTAAISAAAKHLKISYEASNPLADSLIALPEKAVTGEPDAFDMRTGGGHIFVHGHDAGLFEVTFSNWEVLSVVPVPLDSAHKPSLVLAHAIGHDTRSNRLAGLPDRRVIVGHTVRLFYPEPGKEYAAFWARHRLLDVAFVHQPTLDDIKAAIRRERISIYQTKEMADRHLAEDPGYDLELGEHDTDIDWFNEGIALIMPQIVSALAKLNPKPQQEDDISMCCVEPCVRISAIHAWMNKPND